MMISWVMPVNPSHPYLENDPAPSFAPAICAFHLGFSLVDQHPCYDGWNAGVCGSCPHGPNMSWQKPCTKQLIITRILDY